MNNIKISIPFDDLNHHYNILIKYIDIDDNYDNLILLVNNINFDFNIFFDIFTELFKSKSDKCYDIIKILMKKDIDINKPNNNKENIFMMALNFTKNNKIIKLLLEKCPDFNYLNKNNQNMLMLLIKNFNDLYDNIKKEIHEITDIKQKDNDNNDLLIYIISFVLDDNKKIELLDLLFSKNYSFNYNLIYLLENINVSYSIIKYLIQKNISIIDNKTGSITAFMYILKYNKLSNEEKIDLVDVMLKQDFDINYVDNKFRTPIMNLINKHEDNLFLIKSLIERGADINYNFTFMDIIKYTDNIELIKYCKSKVTNFYSINKDGDNILMYCLYYLEKCSLEKIKYLLSFGFNINGINKNNLSPLIIAIKNIFNNSEEKIIEYLLDLGADINFLNPISHAIDNEKFQAINILINRGAIIKNDDIINIVKSKLNENNKIILINKLIEKGFNLDIADINNNTLIIISIIKKNYSLFNLLLNQNVNLDTLNNNDENILMIAIKYMCDKDIIKILLKKEVFIDINKIMQSYNYIINPHKLKYIFEITKLFILYQVNVDDFIVSYLENINFIDCNILHLLFDNGAKINNINTKLIYKVLCDKKYNKLDILKFFITYFTNFIIIVGDNLFLEYCKQIKYEGVFDCIKLLVDNKININNTINGYNCVDYYLRYNICDLEYLRYFIQIGANINNMHNCLSVIFNGNHTESKIGITRLVLQNSDVKLYTDEFLNVITKNRDEYIKLFILYGANINITDKNGYSILMLALKNNNSKLIKFLLDYRINIYYINNKKTIFKYMKELKLNNDIIDIIAHYKPFNDNFGFKDLYFVYL